MGSGHQMKHESATNKSVAIVHGLSGLVKAVAIHIAKSCIEVPIANFFKLRLGIGSIEYEIFYTTRDVPSSRNTVMNKIWQSSNP